MLELILLSLDMRTLLISAQRVCHKWHNLIQVSHSLQAALFFKPVKYKLPRGTQRLRNPLVEEIIWPKFIRTRGEQTCLFHMYCTLDLPRMNKKKEKAYLRENASWRRMLLQQPPTSIVGIIETSPSKFYGGPGTPLFTEAIIRPHRRVLRMGVFDHYRTWNHFFPFEQTGIFWVEQGLSTRDLEARLRVWKDEISDAISKYLLDCEVVFFTPKCDWLRHRKSPDESTTGLEIMLEKWLTGLIYERDFIPLSDA